MTGQAVDRAPARWRRWAAVVVGAQALAVAGFAASATVRLVTGEAVVARNEAMLAATLGLFAVVLGFIGRGLAQGRRAVRGASVTWHLLILLALGGGLWQSGSWLGAATVAVVAVTGGALSVLATGTSGGPS